MQGSMYSSTDVRCRPCITIELCDRAGTLRCIYTSSHQFRAARRMLASANQYGEPAQFQIEKEESPIVRRRSFRDACIQSASRTGRSAAGSGEAAFSGSLALKRDRQGQTKDKNVSFFVRPSLSRCSYLKHELSTCPSLYPSGSSRLT